MADQWFTLEQVKAEQKACPLSMGQAEAGRYTFCVGDQCMAWHWDPKETEENLDNTYQVSLEDYEKNEEGEWTGWFPTGPAYEFEGKKLVTIMQKPTRGRCGMVPRNVS